MHSTPPVEEIDAAIYEVFIQFRGEGIQTRQDINTGSCEAFANTVNDALNDALELRSTADVLDTTASQPQPWHVWLFDGDLHFDAEHPQGVEHWKELSFFQRVGL